MKRLMFALTMDSRLMDAAGDGGGSGGNGGTPPTNGGNGGTPPTDGGQGGQGGNGGTPPTDGGNGGTPPTDGGTPPNNGGEPPANGGDKPFLGGGKAEPGKQDGGDNGGEKKDGQQPQPPDEKAYLDAVVKDEAVFGKDDNLVFDQNLIKAVIPACQKHGIAPEAAKDIANAFAKAQFDGARAAYKERCDYFAKMNGEAKAKYSDSDFEQINRGIDKYFKPGGIMNNVIRNSELGADPEFLALMPELGAAAKEDAGKGAAAGGGAASGDANGINGLSKLW